MNIIIDAMGGDHAPSEIVKGAAEASKIYESKLILVGNQPVVEKILKENDAVSTKIDIVHTDVVVTMEDDPISVVRAKKESSMGVGLRMLKTDDADAMVSAGNTGALHAGSSLLVRPVKGVHRSGIATLLPFARPVLMMDCGANTNVTAEYLEQWAIMGSIYMKNVHHIESPAVGLLNNGTEEAKGTQVQIDAYQKLKALENISFAGNVESREIPFGPCDVLVTDGFTGNITLKLVEGMAKFLLGTLKSMYTKNTLTKMAYLMMKDQLKQLKSDFDASEYGGAPLLGLKKPVIKAHGSSDARAICNAVRQAEAFVRTGVIDQIGEAMAVYDKRAVKAEENDEQQ
ncbi:MAG: phosphate acyltransferase PlsX [Ruminococcaceae bacterium]|nr:phosphate acyltransferase PlsX [Oscillospiraceae bacterium]